MNRTVIYLTAIAAIAGGLIYYYVFDGAIPSKSNYAFDIDEIRRLGDAPADDLPYDIRLEVIARPSVPCFALRPGCFGQAEMTRASFQVVTASGNYMLETGMDEDLAREYNQHEGFSEVVWTHTQEALSAAKGILATHEHPDHMGGIVRHRDPASLTDKLYLTGEQFAALAGLAKTGALPDALRDVEPINLSGPHRIAPGIVMIPAPGHTPGSVIFYVKMSYGAEVLFIGDIAYTLENVIKGLDRPRFVRFLMVSPEDRNAVIHQLKALHDLSIDHPDILIVPAHDEKQISLFLEEGVFAEGFFLPAPEAVVDAGKYGDRRLRPYLRGRQPYGRIFPQALSVGGARKAENLANAFGRRN